MPTAVAAEVTPFAQRLGELRRHRGLSYREFGKLTHYSHTYLWEIESGRKQPTPHIAAKLDEALEAHGELAGMATEHPSPVVPDVSERLAAVAANPRQLDTATIDALAAMLAHQRRLEDRAGSALLVAPVVGQLALIEALVTDSRDPLRPAMVGLGAQWAQFAGWLCATTGDHRQGQAWYLRAMEWASEAGDPNMVATALSMRGHLAWIRDEIPAMLSLSQAAQWPPTHPAVRALAAQQEARAHAILGDADACDAKLDQAEALAFAAVERPDQLPPWLYFFKPDFFTLQRGLAQRLLGRHDQAVELLTLGLDQVPDDIRRSDWIGWYVCQLAASLADTGDAASAEAPLAEAGQIAAATGAQRLTRDVQRVARQLGL